MAAKHAMDDTPPPGDLAGWFVDHGGEPYPEALGFRAAPGGVHLSKTMMLAELTAAMDAAPVGEAIKHAVLIDNVLGKGTGAARRLALSRLNTLYGIGVPLPIQAAALRLWPRNAAGRPILALLCALAREPLLRATANVVLSASQGTSVRWPDLAAAVERGYPGRYSPKTVQSLARNCASSWNQSGHLKGKINKRRAVADPSPEAAAFAALLGTMAGFGGPALLRSPWMLVLDRSEADMLSLLRRAESAGLAQVRAGGGVVQIGVRRPMAQMLEIPDLADR